jgi:hypothetical protein
VIYGKTFRDLEPVRTFKEVGAAIGCSDNAAQKIHDRAVAKLHRLIVERGISFEDFFPREPKGYGKTEGEE